MIYLFSMLPDKSNNLQLICLHFNDMMTIVIADKSIETGHNIIQIRCRDVSQGGRVQIKGVLQLALGHVLAQKSFQLAQKTIFDEQVCQKISYELNSPEKPQLPIGQLKNKTH